MSSADGEYSLLPQELSPVHQGASLYPSFLTCLAPQPLQKNILLLPVAEHPREPWLSLQQSGASVALQNSEISKAAAHGEKDGVGRAHIERLPG